MKLTIKDKEVELKYSFRSLLMWENITNKEFELKTKTDVLLYMLCVILSSDKTMHLTFDELLDMIDENPQLMVDFSEWFVTEMKKQAFLAQDVDVEKEESKKK